MNSKWMMITTVLIVVSLGLYIAMMVFEVHMRKKRGESFEEIKAHLIKSLTKDGILLMVMAASLIFSFYKK